VSVDAATIVPSVLQVCGAPDGGAAEHVLRLSSGLAARGWQVRVCGPPGWLSREASAAGFDVIDLDFTRAPHPRRDLAVLAGLVGEVRRNSYDIVHLHSSKAGALGRLAARTARVPSVYTPHAWPFLMDAGGGSRTVWRTIERLGARLGAAVICVSEAEHLAGLRARSLGRGAVAVIPNGVEIPPAAVQVREDGHLVVGTIARLTRQKGLDVLLASAALVLESRPHTRFVIVGDGPDRGRLREQAAALGIGHAVEVRQDLVGRGRDVLPEFDVFALASRWEGMPIALLEAGAAGLPCVATDVGGVTEILHDGVSGRVVPPEDPEALAGALHENLASAATRRVRGAALRRRIGERFGLDAMVGAIEVLYLEVALGRELEL
jgi:glycosyltransferase involved in cell wall biosynthesis